MSGVKAVACVFIALSIILAIVAIAFRKKGQGINYFISKCFASAVFVFVGLFSYLETNAPKELVIFIIAGLVFGFLGDAILGGKEIDKLAPRKPFIIWGIIAFLLGHILFSVGFILTTGINTYVFVIPTVLAVISLVIFIVLKYQVKAPIFVLLTVYAFLETLMCSSAGYLMITTNNVGYIVAFVGSVFFCTSDLVLSYVYFGPNKSKKDLLVMIELTTYYTAQILISSAVLFM